MSLTVGTAPFGHRPAAVQLRAAAHQGADLLRGLAAADPRAPRRRDGRRQPPREAAARARAPADLLLPRGRGPHGPAGARATSTRPARTRARPRTGRCTPAARSPRTRCGAIPSRSTTRRRSPATSPSTGTRWTSGSRRTSRRSCTRATPITGSTSSTPRATCASALTASRSPTRRAPRALYETGLPPRWYVPRDDVRMDLLEADRNAHRLRLQGIRVLLVVGDGGRPRVVLSRPAPRGGADRGTTSRSSTSASTSRSTASCRSARVTQWSRGRRTPAAASS